MSQSEPETTQQPDSDEIEQAEEMGQPVYGDPSVTELDAEPGSEER